MTPLCRGDGLRHLYVELNNWIGRSQGRLEKRSDSLQHSALWGLANLLFLCHFQTWRWKDWTSRRSFKVLCNYLFHRYAVWVDCSWSFASAVVWDAPTSTLKIHLFSSSSLIISPGLWPLAHAQTHTLFFNIYKVFKSNKWHYSRSLSLAQFWIVQLLRTFQGWMFSL